MTQRLIIQGQKRLLKRRGCPGGSKNKVSVTELKKNLKPIRAAMDEVFACDTAFGDCLPGRPSAGHCVLAAMVIQDLFGGQIMGGDIKSGKRGVVPHYWNKIDGISIDVTGDQFGKPPIQVKRGNLYKGEPFARKPYECLCQPYNHQVWKMHKKFVRRLIPELKKRKLTAELNQLKRVKGLS